MLVPWPNQTTKWQLKFSDELWQLLKLNFFIFLTYFNRSFEHDNSVQRWFHRKNNTEHWKLNSECVVHNQIDISFTYSLRLFSWLHNDVISFQQSDSKIKCRRSTIHTFMTLFFVSFVSANNLDEKRCPVKDSKNDLTYDNNRQTFLHTKCYVLDFIATIM